ncbi:MAG: crosslink repair DNA glycosylase YcaQ family protein, partial [Betaproteobacteria bacterium]
KLGNAVRSLGPEGVKKGLATTLPLALGLLQSRGEIRRLPVNGRIDQQRYKYAAWKITPEGSFTDLARLYFGWIGAASASEFQWFSGLGVKATKVALEPLGLVPFQDDLLALPEDLADFQKFQVPQKPQYVLTGILDNICHLRKDATSVTEKRVGSRLSELANHAIFDRGLLVGLWDFDPETGTVVWHSFVKKDRALTEAVERMEAFIREDLGDARTFSLDGPKARAPRIAALRKAAAG